MDGWIINGEDENVLQKMKADSESSVITIGVSLIVLNGLMYVGIPGIVIVGVREF